MPKKNNYDFFFLLKWFPPVIKNQYAKKNLQSSPADIAVEILV